MTRRNILPTQGLTARRLLSACRGRCARLKRFPYTQRALQLDVEDEARQVFDQTCGRGHTARRSRKKGSSRLRDCLEIIQTSIWRSALSQGVSVSSITCDTQHNDVGQTHACGHAFTCARASIHNAMMWGRPMHVVMCFGNKVRRTGINGSAEGFQRGT